MREEGDALVHLLGNRTVAMAIDRIECAIIAIGATTRALGAVAIGTGETAIDGNLLHLEIEMAAHIIPIIIIVESFFSLHCKANVRTNGQYTHIFGQEMQFRANNVL